MKYKSDCKATLKLSLLNSDGTVTVVTQIMTLSWGYFMGKIPFFKTERLISATYSLWRSGRPTRAICGSGNFSSIAPSSKSPCRGLKTPNRGYIHFDSFPALCLACFGAWPSSAGGSALRLCLCLLPSPALWRLLWLNTPRNKKPSTGHYSGLQRAKGKPPFLAASLWLSFVALE